ncbi:MAG: hypothetical protein ACD_2C00181G0011 [uncultured bacterium (gcode 4)]|uniref:Uncharacterized protein n=1 Tax=uncultured bacterium (gcode 4) TaxID=1234023 RepID=K2G2H3_9BACT|nr:MAG: hypothetical protein ACD_2C00181G0011 [uncultured bacterium (gcode 4)]
MKNYPINLREVCNQTINIEKDIYINMTEFGPAEYRDILNHSKPITLWEWSRAENVTILDLFNLPLKKDEEIISFIKSRLKIDITTAEWVKRINDLMSYAIRVYEERYLRTLPFKIKNKSFKSANSIIDFLRETKTNKWSWTLNCAIAKICYAVDDVISNEKIRRAEFLDYQFIKEYLDRPFQIEEWFTDSSWNLYRIWKAVISGKVINFKLISRQKSKESLIWKVIVEPTYYSIDKVQDFVGASIYVDTNEDAILMMQYIDQLVYNWECRIKNKNALTKVGIAKNEKLNATFKKKLLASIWTDDDHEYNPDWEKEFKERSRKWTSSKYKEVKMVWEVPLALEEWEKATKFMFWTEVKFVIGWHDNESWISLQAIYDYIKRPRELTRLGLPIRKLDLVKYVNDFFENIDDMLRKKNKKKDVYYQELYADLRELWYIDEADVLWNNNEKNEKILAFWLYKHFRNQLVKIKMSNSKQTYYFDERALRLRDVGLHKPQLQKI